MTVNICSTCSAIIIASIVTVDRCIMIVTVVTAVVVVGAVVVVMIPPPRVTVVRFTPYRIVVRMSPTETPVGAVIRVSEAPIPIIVPRVCYNHIVVTSATIWTVKSVDTSGIAVVDNYNIGIIVVGIGVFVNIYIVVGGNVSVSIGVFIFIGLRLSISRSGNGLLFGRVAVNVVAATVACSVKCCTRAQYG